MSSASTNILRRLLESPNTPTQRPGLRANFQSNVSGLYIIGDLAGAPVVKLAMEQGSAGAEHIAATLADKSSDPNIYDLVVIGAGAAGLNAALGAQDRGLRAWYWKRTRSPTRSRISPRANGFTRSRTAAHRKASC